MIDEILTDEMLAWLRDGGPWTLQEWRIVRKGPPDGWWGDDAGQRYRWEVVYPTIPLSVLLRA